MPRIQRVDVEGGVDKGVNPTSPLKNAENITVLIPAAGRVPEGLVALSNISCTAMVPVAGRPVIYWTLRYLRSLGLKKFIIAVPKRGLFIEEFVAYTAGPDCECTFVVPPDKSESGLASTVRCLLDATQTLSALVVLGDTYFQFANTESLSKNQPMVLTGPVQESYRWCVVEVDQSSTISKIKDKQSGLVGPLNALIGVYYFPQSKKALEIVDSLFEKEDRERITIGSILEHVHLVTPIQAEQAGEWLDCGNPDRQAASHIALLQKREFTELTIDRRHSTITKHSRLREKFIDEIEYLQSLPPEVAIFFPRVVNASTEEKSPHLTLEFYGYGTLADMFVYENVDPGIWERAFRHIFEILTEVFARYARPIDHEHVVDMYLGKTERRLAELAARHTTLGPLIESRDVIRINGRPVHGIHTLWPRIEAEIKSDAETANGSIIHGDLCFSNVLYDVRSQILRMVDPRGSFGAKGIFGDQRYDVAKLYHSVFGLYDFISNDLFSLSQNGADITLQIYTPTQQQEILARFEKIFFPRFNKRSITLITALLFASLPALHYDTPKRQFAFYIRALQILSELYPVDSNHGMSEHES